MPSQTILFVDPETDFLAWARQQLQSEDVRVLIEETADAALKTAAAESPDLVMAELSLHPYSGLELLDRIREESPNALVVLMSAFSTNQNVIEGMKRGAFDFVRKEDLPFNLKVVANTALRAAADLKAANAFQPVLTVEQHQDEIVGRSEPMQAVFKLIGRVAASDATVMVTGESGTGKELVARALHQYSARCSKSFLAINCAAIPDNLLESELFGHEKGAFTGAQSRRVGRFEQSDGGTLFLDEIGEMPLSVQSKILRVLQEGEFSRVGSNTTLRANVRIVCATNRLLEEEVKKKTFREDLFYRLNVVRIPLPSLRERKDDIRVLAEYFLQRVTHEKHRPSLKLSEAAAKVLEAYPWPGNVRELENTMQRAAVLTNADILLPKDIPLGQASPESPAQAGTMPLDEALERVFAAADADPSLALLPWMEQEFTRRAMEKTGGNQLRAAKLLGITRATLRKRLERDGLLGGAKGDS